MNDDYIFEIYLNEYEYLPYRLRQAIVDGLIGLTDAVDVYLDIENRAKDTGEYSTKLW